MLPGLSIPCFLAIALGISMLIDRPPVPDAQVCVISFSFNPLKSNVTGVKLFKKCVRLGRSIVSQTLLIFRYIDELQTSRKA